MKFKKQISSIVVSTMLVLGSMNLSYADGTNVVTLGANLSESQKQQMLNYFGVKKDQVLVLDVTNAEERQYLQGVATEGQLGKVTISCSYVEPTKKGNGINVKTANLTWVTSSMIASTLTTAGLEDANVIAAAPYPVSGTGALTGIMKAFEDASGKKLDETKKEIASEELVVTGDLGDDIGQEKATGVMNDIKTEIVKNGTKDTNQIANTINNVVNNYNITITPEQKEQIKGVMKKIADQNYDYNSMKNTLDNVSDNVNEQLKKLGESVKGSGILDTIGGWFSGIGDWFSGLFSGGDKKDLGILNNTNDEALGSDAVINSTEGVQINPQNNTNSNNDSDTNSSKNDTSSNNENNDNSQTNENNTTNNSENQSNNNDSVGFFEKIKNWLSGLF